MKQFKKISLAFPKRGTLDPRGECEATKYSSGDG